MLHRSVGLEHHDDRLLSEHSSDDFFNARMVCKPSLRAEAEHELRDVDVRMVVTPTKVVHAVKTKMNMNDKIRS